MTALPTSSPKILCVGIAVRDLVFRVRRVPETGKKTSAQSFGEIGGGNAVNAAVGIARLGARAEFCGPVGEDADALLASLAREGVGIDHVVRVPGVVTPISSILIDETGERTIATYRPKELASARAADPDALVADCHALTVDNRFPDFATPICAAAMRRGIPVVVDVDRAMDHTSALMNHATHVLFSEQGLQDTSGEADVGHALTVMAKATPALVGVTRGPQGVVWRESDGSLSHMPAFKVNAVDTLGAGDVFHGALALALAEGQSTPAALRFAAAAAALKCTHFGGAFGTPPRSEVEALLANTPPQSAQAAGR